MPVLCRYAPALVPEEGLRVAFVGLGFAAGWLHVPAVRALEGAVITGGADPDAQRRDEWAAKIGGPTYASHEALFDATSPTLVVVASPPSSHAEVCIAALERGANVICEKPFVETLEQADAVLAAAAANQRYVAVNQEFRYMPIFSALSKEIGAPRTGRPVFVHCTQFMDLAPWDEPVPWRASMTNRSLFEGGVHIVDLVCATLGRVPERVFAMRSSGIDRVGDADAIHLVTMDFGGGLLAQITIDRLCRAGTRYLDVRVDCEHASLRASYGGRALLRVGVERGSRPGVRVDFGPGGLAWAERGLARRRLAANARDATAKATTALYADAVAAMRAHREPPTSGHVARDVLRVIDAAYRSSETGLPVDLTET